MAEDEATFRARAEAALESLDQAFSRLSSKYGVEADLAEGVLKIGFEVPEPAVFVVSANAPARQVWVSARLSSFKFDWIEAINQFGLHRTGEPLLAVLQRLAREQLGDQSVAL